MRRLVYGLGRSGLGVLAYLQRHGLSASFYDDKLKPEEAEQALRLGFTLEPNPTPGLYDQVIAAPGVPIQHPRLAALREGGAEVIGEAELVYRHSQTPLIGITGTAGKTSCTLFTGHFLRALGFKAVEGGNIDPPLASVVDDAEVVAAEMSSFQLERVVHFRPRVAVLLLLGVDHLDRHGSLEAYHAAKLNLIKNLTAEDALVYNAKDPRILAGIEGSPARRYPFEPANSPRETNLNAALQAALAYAQIVQREQPGRTWAVEPSAQGLAPYRATAPQPEARYEVFAHIGGLQFIDDSIATRLDSVRMALEAAPGPVAWILGGVDKGAPSAELLEVVARKVRLILAVGRDGPHLAAPLRGQVEVVEISEPDGRKALREAVLEALQRLTTGSVLLAPLAASFDQFKDYKERSRVFREVVMELGGVHG
ncbi:MAG: UDP-N-acetylmuramoyl-L-alanine--D-glutamate ligase [Meiothermus ruber]|jgi:UDP-N-acetylmuramoylalanine--D-glutamate ligase|uniref:UDP-N-acetylmuramoyl-L-alanine--D-glutamate ligase n=1 Tax=Meiothermus ruber TaxID=277 RepID=UPI0023FA27C0|nr:UDP-N-acetylmuramoyl-L-alanine--D-glutamate ligase [Meiothermus ruber]MCL6531273.1 UDP-N-acetylmuramoyl-L-alanine--D-glutamate ligase [Meiothermus ruber]